MLCFSLFSLDQIRAGPSYALSDVFDIIISLACKVLADATLVLRSRGQTGLDSMIQGG